MNIRKNIRIKGTGAALPSKCVTSASIDQAMGYKQGFTESKTGLKQRYYVEQETAADLACVAIQQALDNAQMDINQIDCLIAASGTMEQAIPYNAAFIHSQLKCNRPIPSFDINMTCLSALTAIDVGAALITLNQYQTVLIVSSDIASVGADWKNIHVGGIFGDGAASVILGRSDTAGQGILGSLLETHSDGLHFCEIRGGGTRHHPRNVEADYRPYGLFEMQGKQVYKLAARHIQTFLDRLLEQTGLSINEIDWVVPHQASAAALQHMTKALSLNKDRVINIFARQGNQVAASLPTALHELLSNYPVKPGERILLIGTSAGLGFGGLVLEY